MILEFKEFINRGNVVDLAVAVVIGAAFGAVVTSFTDDVLMQGIAAVVGEPNFDALTFELRDAPIHYGAFLTAVTSFLIVAVAVFLLVKALNAAQRSRTRAESVEDAEATPEPSEVDLLREIRDLLAAAQS